MLYITSDFKGTLADIFLKITHYDSQDLGFETVFTFVGLRPCLVSYIFSQDLRPFFKINSRSCLFKDSSFHRLAVVGAVALRSRDTSIQFSSWREHMIS